MSQWEVYQSKNGKGGGGNTAFRVCAIEQLLALSPDSAGAKRQSERRLLLVLAKGGAVFGNPLF